MQSFKSTSECDFILDSFETVLPFGRVRGEIASQSADVAKVSLALPQKGLCEDVCMHYERESILYKTKKSSSP